MKIQSAAGRRELESRANHRKRKNDRATREVPQTLNLIPFEQAEGTNVLDGVCIVDMVGVTPTQVDFI